MECRAGEGRPPRPPEAAPSALTFWALCGWIGLACGLIEGILQLAWRRIECRFASPDLWDNWHQPWLTPLSLATLSLGPGLLAGLARGVAPRISTRLVPLGLVAAGTWSILGVFPEGHPWASALLVAA